VDWVEEGVAITKGADEASLGGAVVMAVGVVRDDSTGSSNDVGSNDGCGHPPPCPPPQFRAPLSQVRQGQQKLQKLLLQPSS
jgi:hypothetical protein